MCEKCVPDCPGCEFDRSISHLSEAERKRLKNEASANGSVLHRMKKSPELVAWVNAERAKLGLPPLDGGT